MEEKEIFPRSLPPAAFDEDERVGAQGSRVMGKINIPTIAASRGFDGEENGWKLGGARDAEKYIFPRSPRPEAIDVEGTRARAGGWRGMAGNQYSHACSTRAEGATGHRQALS